MSDNNSTISVCIGNYGYYNEGELHDTWIDLPVDPKTIHPWLVTHRLYDRFHEEIYISDYDGIPLGCSYGNLFSEFTLLEHLNILAKLIEMYPDEAEILTEFCSLSKEEPENILGLCNWLLQAYDLPYYSYGLSEYHDNDSPEEKFGTYVAQDTVWWEELVRLGLSDYFDLEQYGKYVAENCVLGDNGYVDLAVDFPDQNKYDWKDIQDIIDSDMD